MGVLRPCAKAGDDRAYAGHMLGLTSLSPHIVEAIP